MFAVIFEVQPKKGRFDEYLSLAKYLKPELEKIDGFMDNERFGSRRTDGRILSLSIWRDEKALVRWRTLGVHHEVQEKGRLQVFEDYHLRVGEITADTHLPEGETLAEHRLDVTEVGAAKVVTISELTDRTDLARDLGLPEASAFGLVDHEVYDSIYNPGKALLLASWRDAEAASHWRAKFRGSHSGEARRRQVRVIRDYGMSDRREAPQYYPPVRGAS